MHVVCARQCRRNSGISRMHWTITPSSETPLHLLWSLGNVRVSAALYLCIRWIAYCPSICCTCAFTGLLIVRASVILVHSLDCLLSRYMSYLRIRWIAYCPSMHTCAFAGCVLSQYLLLHLCFRIKYRIICYTCAFA